MYAWTEPHPDGNPCHRPLPHDVHGRYRPAIVREPTFRIAAVSNTQTLACVGFVNAGTNARVTFSIAGGNLIIGASLLGE